MSFLTEAQKNNLKVAIAALRINPRKYKQIKGQLTDNCDGRCGGGLVLEAFHVNPNSGKAYDELARLIGNQPMEHIISKNDGEKRTFSGIADALDAKYSQELA